VLRRAGLVTSHKAGRQRVYELRILGFTELARWLTPYVVLRQRMLDDRD
jgi:DNA-binding PadR family transcriptional regulator